MNAPHAPADTTHAPLFAAHVPALLALADGTVFRGRSIGATGQSVGEVVFNTAMTGYQEILTDPSYAGQIVTLDLSAHRQRRRATPRMRSRGGCSPRDS